MIQPGWISVLVFSMGLQSRQLNFVLMPFLEKAEILSPNLSINFVLERLYLGSNNGKYSTEFSWKKHELNFVISLSLTSVIVSF